MLAAGSLLRTALTEVPAYNAIAATSPTVARVGCASSRTGSASGFDSGCIRDAAGGNQRNPHVRANRIYEFEQRPRRLYVPAGLKPLKDQAMSAEVGSVDGLSERPDLHEHERLCRSRALDQVWLSAP